MRLQLVLCAVACCLLPSCNAQLIQGLTAAGIGGPVAVGSLFTLNTAMLIALILSFGGTKKKLRRKIGRPILVPYHRSSYTSYRMSKSISGPTTDSLEDEEELLLSAIEELDTLGCVPKMLCHLQTKSRDQWNAEETALVDTFSSTTNAAFLFALDLGSRVHNPIACDRAYPKCTLQDTDLRASLQTAGQCTSFLETLP
ncbi:uncharacterized protein LOC134769719 [Penaeus indicus]|uniref:uncharacterized protein LOC134769719 n=1 Tax=Penaeus indicus TaxID=29960 RepID=UPI00300C653A